MSEDKANKFIGEVKVTGKGIGYFTNPDDENNDFEIQTNELATAMNRDRVRIEPLNKDLGGRKQAKVVEIEERHKTSFVGELEKEGENFFLIPDDKRMYRDIVILKESMKGAADGDKVQAEIVKWDDPVKSPYGEVRRVIGKAGEHNTEMLGIVYESGFEVDFPPEVEAEAEAWRAKYQKEDKLVGRKDFRDRTTFTIDPDDAKDFDDALSIKPLEDGQCEVGIHIADVSHFVTPGSTLDQEAKRRGTSIYLVDRTIPMLPEVLSNDLCSLNPNEPKYAFSAVFILSSEGEVRERWFGKTLIESDKRFTYDEAQNTLDKGSGPFYEELRTLNEISYKLREKKFAAGAIEFETEEVKFELDNLGRPTKVYRKERKDTHKLIEDFMLLANREVARYMHDAYKEGSRAAFVYRIHDKPDREKIIDLATFVKALGYELKHKDGEITAHDLNKMLKAVDETPVEMLVKTAAIRAMQKAVYSTRNIGHFGLAFEYYTHFTSPIRRYPDLMVHRLLQRFIVGGKIEQDEMIKYEKLSVLSSERELEATEAERASIKYKQVEFMSEHIGEEFDATISGVSEYGIFVEENETKAEGLVRIRDLGEDFYELDRKSYAVVGQKSGKRYALGDQVQVKLVNSDMDRKTLDFELINTEK